MIWILLALIVADVVIVALGVNVIRNRPRMDRNALLASGAGLAGFVVHALMFFQGAFLVIQLTAIACIFLACWVQHMGGLGAR